MATKIESTEITQPKKIYVKSEEALDEMEASGQLEPFTDYYTDDELDAPFMPVGSIFVSAIPQTDARVHLLDGSTIAQDGIYANFANLIKALHSAGNSITCTQAEFDADVLATGNCGKFVIDNTAGTIRLPKITTFIQGLSNIANIGSSLSAGLPNITGTFGDFRLADDSPVQSGAFKLDLGVSRSCADNVSTATDKDVFSFDASRSNSIYGNSSTVQPNATQYPYYIVLASGYKSGQVVNIDNIMNEVNSKTTLLEAYPIGSIYMSTNSISPAQRFGGTWERLKDRFLLGAGDNYTEIYKDNKDGTYEGIGGSATHTLTVDEMPNHSHNTNINTAAYSGDWVGSWGGYSPRQSSGNYFQGGTTATGGNQPHNNMPPYATVYMWQRVEDDDSGIELY